MRKIAWVGISLLAPGAVLVPGLVGDIWTVLSVIIQLWWVLPLAASLGSLLALAIHDTLRPLGAKKASGFPTPAYLVSGPAMAALNLMSFFSLGSSPPPWVGSMMLALLCLSAWFYYQAIKQSDEDKGAVSANEPPFSSLEG